MCGSEEKRESPCCASKGVVLPYLVIIPYLKSSIHLPQSVSALFSLQMYRHSHSRPHDSRLNNVYS
jgi:hypothetical protein